MADPTALPPDGPDWRTREAGEPTVRRRNRLWLPVALLALLLIGGTWVAVVAWLQPLRPPAFVPLWVVDNPADRSVIPWAAQDRAALIEGEFLGRPVADVPANATRDRILHELAALRTRRSWEPVVVYLSVPACCTGPDSVQLLPADATPDAPRNRLALREVLELLRACPSRHKLLVLDVAAPVESMHGPADGDVASAVQAELEAVADPNRLTLLPCSPGQQALASADLGRTVFGHYLEEGLRGWADGYGPGGERDGRVSVRELAEFVRARVDRWSRQNRPTVQTPLLHGSAEDFALRAFAGAHPQPPRALPEPEAYPDWLRTAWATRERWRQEGYARSAPRLFRELEAALLHAEQAWLGGRDTAAVQDRLGKTLAKLEERLTAFRAVPLPKPLPSLALAAEHGPKPDPAVLEALKVALAKFAAAPPPAPGKPAPPIPEAEAIKAKPHADLAAAVWEVVVTDPRPQPDRIRFLSELLITPDRQPRYLETLFLHRLAAYAEAPGPSGWPTERVRRLIDLVRQTEAFAARPASFDWLEPSLAGVAQQRHDAEVLFFAPGYVSDSETERLLRQATDSTARLRTQAAAQQAARDLFDEALMTLPALDAGGASEATWLAAVDGACELADLLKPPAAQPSADVLAARIADGQPKAAALRSALDELRRPFSDERVAELLARLKAPDASPAVLGEAESLLRTPFLNPDARASLRQAARASAVRLNQETMRQDRSDDERHQPTTAPSSAPAPDEAATKATALHRARRSIALLRLGGYGGDDLRNLQTLLARLEAPETTRAALTRTTGTLSLALNRAWLEDVPALLRTGKDRDAADRLARVIPANELASLLDDPARNPTTLRRSAEAKALWAWNANRCRYESHDPTDPAPFAPGSGFLAAAARSFQAAGTPTPPESSIEITGGPDTPTLTPAATSVTYPLRLRLLGGADERASASLRYLQASDDWFRTTAESTVQLTTLNEVKLPLGVELLTDRPLPGPLPRGVLVQATLAGRTFHSRVPVGLDEVANRLELRLAADPKGPADPLRDLRLRPLKGKQPFTLMIHNPRAGERAVIVQLLVNGAVIPGGESAKLVLGPNETRPVAFAPPPPAPPPAAPPSATPPAAPAPAIPKELPELKGPLEVRVLDAARPKVVLESRLVRVEVANPAEYVDVSDIRFVPAPKGGGSRLTVALRATGSLAGPECVAELVFPAEQDSGLSVRDGSLRGVVPKTGQPLTLYADDLRVPDGGEPSGLISLTIDGSERAYVFRASFPRGSTPVRPAELPGPALRLRSPAVAASEDLLPVRVEADRAPDGSTLELGLGRRADGAFVPDVSRSFPSARQRRVGFAPSADGKLLDFEAVLRDWEEKLPTEGIVGRRALRARLLDRGGKELAVAYREVVLDPTPPERVQFIDPPQKARRDQPVLLRAQSAPSVSGIAKVQFFFGRPVNNQPPPNAVLFPAAPADPKRLVWEAKLKPGDHKEGTAVTVQFVNGAGRSSFATEVIDFLDPADFARQPNGSIAGRVMEGDRPQGGLVVVLRNAKGEPAGQTKTDRDGTFAFEDLPPGKYGVESSKPVTNRFGSKPVEVRPGKPTPVTIELFLK